MKIIKNYNSDNDRYFSILGKSLSIASEFEKSCIELAKFCLIKNQINKKDYPSTKFDYLHFKQLIKNEENKKLFEIHRKKDSIDKQLNNFITDINFSNMDKKIFFNAKNMRNKIAHEYPYMFLNNLNNENELKILCKNLKNDLIAILNGNLLILFINSIIFDSEHFSYKYLEKDNKIDLNFFIEMNLEWVFK